MMKMFTIWIIQGKNLSQNHNRWVLRVSKQTFNSVIRWFRLTAHEQTSHALGTTELLNPNRRPQSPPQLNRNLYVIHHTEVSFQCIEFFIFQKIPSSSDFSSQPVTSTPKPNKLPSGHRGTLSTSSSSRMKDEHTVMPNFFSQVYLIIIIERENVFFS
jgi:hypothetical protein